MGAPAGHPFFGNQFTDGGYKLGSFTYAVVEKGIDAVKDIISETAAAQAITDTTTRIDTVKNVISETGKGAAPIAIKPKADKLIPKKIVAKIPNKNTLIIGSIIVGAVAIGGFITYKLLRRKSKASQAPLQTIELRNVGICVNCGESLIGSTYLPESKEGSHDEYIICKSCGAKNFARYPDESELPNNNSRSQNDEEETK